MSAIINAISAIGNNSSIAPLIIRDCGIENPTKLGLTYKQNLKKSPQMARDAIREKAIKEYGTSAVWLGGIPLMNAVCDTFIKKMGYNPKINPKLFKETNSQGLNFNLDKFKSSAASECADIEKILKNKKTYENLLAVKFIASTAIPIAVMGFILPKLNFKLTEKLKEKRIQKENSSENKSQLNLNSIQKEFKGNNSINFKGNFATKIANLSTVNQMAITDVGLTVGRINTGRNKNEKIEAGLEMTVTMLLNYVTPTWIEKLFAKSTDKVFGININLDPKLLNDKSFLEAVKNDEIELPEENVVEFLDKKPKAMFSKLCSKFCDVKYLENDVRDPRNYIDEDKISNFKKEIEAFISQAKNSSDIEKFARKALKIKSLTILLNIVTSSALLAFGLPKLMFLIREKRTGRKNEPGLD